MIPDSVSCSFIRILVVVRNSHDRTIVRRRSCSERPRFAYAQVHTQAWSHQAATTSQDVFGSMESRPVPISNIRVIGRTFRFIGKGQSPVPIDVFDRQVRAFGSGLQQLLQTLTIGVVGIGGTVLLSANSSFDSASETFMCSTVTS